VGPGVRLLDVGTGSGGTVAIPAAQRGAEVVGADVTGAWFPAALRRAEQAGVDVEWVIADVVHMPFESGSFDVVTSFARSSIRALSTVCHDHVADRRGYGRRLSRIS
jgi:2-polyprenyl-3-methyl-5-hydroxy-6-metoxy-1,4-benzoquinol methylase